MNRSLKILILICFGTVAFSQTPCPVDSNGVLQGPCVYYDPSPGKHVEVVCTYKDGRLDGIYIERLLYKHRVVVEAYYIDGLLNGLYKKYNVNGRLMYEASYMDGVLNGSEKYYYAFSCRPRVVSMELFYIDGKLNGRQYFYRHDGSLEGYFDCVDGKCGDHFFVDRKGRLRKKILVDETGHAKWYIFYDKKGRVIKEGPPPKKEEEVNKITHRFLCIRFKTRL